MAAPKIDLAVDAQGQPIIDPTANVLQLVEAAVRRLDDLSALRDKTNGKIISLEVRRIDDLRLAESRRVDELVAIRFQYEKQLRQAESGRIDAIRAVDVNAVLVASTRAAEQVTALATTAAATADALRNQVAASAAALAAQLQQTINPILERLAAIEKAQYEGVGKERVTDPIMTQLLVEMKALRQTQDAAGGKAAATDPVQLQALGDIRDLLRGQQTNTGRGQGATALWGYVVGAVGLLISMGLFAITVIGIIIAVASGLPVK